jgi:hypothetical protein
VPSRLAGAFHGIHVPVRVNEHIVPAPSADPRRGRCRVMVRLIPTGSGAGVGRRTAVGASTSASRSPCPTAHGRSDKYSLSCASERGGTPQGIWVSRARKLFFIPVIAAGWRITVKRVRGNEAPDGEVSRWLHANVRAGDVPTVSTPFGDQTLPPGEAPRPSCRWSTTSRPPAPPAR